MASSHAEALPDKRMMRIHELRSKVILGDLPPDFLRLSQQVDQQAQQQHQAEIQAQHGQQHAQQVMSPEEYARYAQMNPMQSFYTFIPPNTRGRIAIKIVEAKLTKNYGLVRMDPYVRVRVGNTIFETNTSISGGKTPTWNRVVNAYLPVGVESIYLQIFDERAFTNDECIAWAHVILPEGIFSGETIDEWYSLSGPQGEGKEGVINLIMNFTPVEVVPPQVHPVPEIPAEVQAAAAPGPLFTEEELNELHVMFPTVDKDVIQSILEEKRGDKDSTVTALLEMTS